MNYVYAEVAPGPNACRLTGLQEVDDTFELLRGVPRAQGFPAEAHFKMNPNFPDDLKLEDVISNWEGVLVVSDRLRQFLEAQRLKNVEFLPVSIVNHKGRTEKAPYFIFHQTVLQDCIDMNQSVVELNDIDPELIADLEKLVVDESRIDPDVAVLRMAHYPFLPLFRRELAQAIEAEGFTGIRFGEVEEWDGG